MRKSLLLIVILFTALFSIARADELIIISDEHVYCPEVGTIQNNRICLAQQDCRKQDLVLTKCPASSVGKVLLSSNSSVSRQQNNHKYYHFEDSVEIDGAMKQFIIGEKSLARIAYFEAKAIPALYGKNIIYDVGDFSGHISIDSQGEISYKTEMINSDNDIETHYYSGKTLCLQDICVVEFKSLTSTVDYWIYELGYFKNDEFIFINPIFTYDQ